ncbi:MAG: STAS domain-containing protein [Umezawaea sp.]
MGDELLVVTSEQVGGAEIVRVAGEVDICTAPRLNAALSAACESVQPKGALVVDLTGVTYFGSFGLSAVVIAHHRCQERRGTFLVVADDQLVLRPLRTSGLDRVFTIVRSTDEAAESYCA